MAHDRRAIIAANNNADLYEAVFAAGGLRFGGVALAAPDCRGEANALLAMIGKPLLTPEG